MLWFIISICLVRINNAEIVISEPKEVSFQVAGIFDRDTITHQQAFNDSLRHVHLNSVRLKPIMLQSFRTDSYSVWRSLCSNQEMRPVMIFGPQTPISDKAVRDQCAVANIPHIQATMKPLDPDLELNEDTGTNDSENETAEEAAAFKKITINFYPESDEVSLAYGNLLNFYGWKAFAVLYEDDFGLLRVQKMLARHSDDYPVTVYRLNPDGDNRNIFKLLYENTEDRILLDCHIDRVMKYMEEAGNFKDLNNYQHYILVTLDASTIYDQLVKLPTNVTWLSLTEFEKVKDTQHYLASRVGKWSDNLSAKVIEMKTDELIMDDIANHVAKALETIEDLKEPETSICEKNVPPWEHGAAVQKAILQTKTFGVTGNVEFNEKGKRINYILHVNEIHMSERYTVGQWDSSNGTEIQGRQNENRSTTTHSKHFVIISRRDKPYFYEKKCKEDDAECLNSKEKYEGFSVDFVKAIFEILRSENYNYTYSFFHDEDKSYGEYNPKTKKWNGLIGDLLDKKADLAVCDVTITEDRKKIVDFSVPFMSLGISILFTHEVSIPPGMFSFLNPYSVDVWLYTATAYCVVSVVLFVCSRISPADWENPEPCEKNPEELENIWTFKNCTWLTMGSIMTQGCDILPKAIGTRWVCGMWWFFSMIVCQTYIAQLSASMTTALENESIKSVEDLAAQNKILYGAIKGGTTYEFFKNSKQKSYRHMYEVMNSNEALLVKTNDEGVERVLKGHNKYAFFMESTSIEYKLRRDCKLKKIGGELDNKYYGIAMPANSPFRTHINRAILKLQESTKLDKIRNLWWLEKYDAINCTSTEVDTSDVEGDLEMENLQGAFVVLIVGIFFCLIVTAVEFMNEVRNIVVRENVSHKEVLIKELKASLNFFNEQKPVLRNASRAPSLAGSEESEDDKKEKKGIKIYLITLWNSKKEREVEWFSGAKTSDEDGRVVVRCTGARRDGTWSVDCAFTRTVAGTFVRYPDKIQSHHKDPQSSEERVVEHSSCGRVWITVHSPERQAFGQRILDALELNWDFRGCSSIPRQIGLFSTQPVAWILAIATFTINSAEGHVITNISLGDGELPAGWDRGAGARGPQCLWPWVGAGNANIEAFNCLKIQPTWMQDNAQRINRLRIGDLALAGSHNAGAWRFDTELSSVARDNFVLCQDRSIWAQLVHGIRYLDFRIGFYDFFRDEDDRYWLNHNLIRVRPLVPLLREIRAFLDSTREVVFLDAHHFPIGFYHPDGSPIREVHRGLLNIIQRELGPHIAPANRFGTGAGTRGPTLQTLINANQRLHFSYVDNIIVNENNWLWPNLPHLWAQTNNPNDLFVFLDRAIANAPQPNARSPMHSAMAQTTPSVLDILLLRGSLRINADIVNRRVTQRLTSLWRPNANIVSTDFFLGNDVIDVAIAVSLERAGRL